MRPSKTEYYILRAMKTIPGKSFKLYKIDGCPDTLDRSNAVGLLKVRGLSEELANKYIDALKYVSTRGSH